MSERLEHEPGHEAPVEHLETDEAAKHLAEASPKPKEVLPAVEEIRHNVVEAEQDSTQSEEVKRSIETAEDHATPEPPSNELKQLMFDRTVKKVQQQLSTTQKSFSKIVHQPVVDRLSEVGGKTVARPSGILIGGLFAFLGSTFYLYITKHNHYQYNYLLFVLFFIGGFIIGIVLELLLFLLRGRKTQKP